MNDHKQPDDGQLPPAREAPYDLQGEFYEACDCYTICPCWTGASPDEDECIGVFAWSIRSGVIDGVSVSGLCAVSVSTHEGHRDSGQQRVMLFVSENASDAQADAMAAAYSGRLGGPLGELSGLLGELLGIERTNIELDWDARRTKLTVGRRIVAEGTDRVGATGKVITLADGRLSTVLGTPAEVGVTQRFRVGLPGHNIDIDLRGRSSMRGRFNYRHSPSTK